MPPKTKSTKAKSKMPVKNLEEKETPFQPVPYETTDICTSITLLSSPELEIVLRALWILSKYADTKDLNVEHLYKNGIVSKLLALISYSDLTILRFCLKILAQIVTGIPDAAKELSSVQCDGEVKKINHIFMTIEDSFIKEFSTLILSKIVKDAAIASYVFRAGVVVPIFNTFKTAQDPDVQLNTLTYFQNVLEAREAMHVLPLTVEFSPKTLLCFLKSKIPEISLAALNILEKLTSWKCGPMQELLRDEKIIEILLNIIMNEDFKSMHKKAFNIIETCMDCPETASYFVKSLEFIEFCQWAKTCRKKYILPSASIITALAKIDELRQLLFDFSTEDTMLSFFRTNNERVFYKTCEAIYYMSSHRYCCQKIVTPIVIQSLLSMLSRSNVPIIPYHEIALDTLLYLMRRDGRTTKFIVASGGIPLLTTCWMRDKESYTTDGYSNLLDMLYILSFNEQFKLTVMNNMMYQMLLNAFDDPSEFSQKALLVLNQYVDNSECRQYFIEFQGPQVILKKIASTPSETVLKDVLIFLQRMLIYKRVAMVFLWAGCLQTLNSICDEVKEAIPLIGQLIGMLYDLYLPIKFHNLGRLEITDHFNSRFHLLKGECIDDFPFLEILEMQQACPLLTVYVVDFSGKVEELRQKVIKLPPSTVPSASLLPRVASSVRKVRSSQQNRKRNSSILKNSFKYQRSGSVQLEDAASVREDDAVQNYLTCQVPPPVNYGYISEDPYLPKYVEQIKLLMYDNKKYIMCFHHQVKLVAHFVNDLLSGPEGIDQPLDVHCFDLHLESLKQKLGINIIPIGYLRCGSYCERALLFKCLAEKVGVPATLVKGQIKQQNSHLYWNEVAVVNDEPFANIDDGQKTNFAYAVVNLIDRIGELMLVGSMEANKYCGII